MKKSVNKSDHELIFPDVLKDIKKNVFDHCDISLLNPFLEKESQEYGACHFEIDDLKITFRVAKITPTKIGQFVTLWKRNGSGLIQPFDIKDNVDYFIIRSNNKDLSGQFIFPKHVLYEKGIVSGKKKGKLGFRIYSSWDIPTNKQAQATQKWQLEYFLESSKDKPIDKARAKFLLNYKK